MPTADDLIALLSPGEDVVIPAGTYTIDKTVNVTVGAIAVRCQPGARFVADSALPSSLFKFRGGPLVWEGGVFDSSAVLSGDKTDNSGTCISLDGIARGWSVSGAQFLAGTSLDATRGDTGLHTFNCQWGTIRGNYFRGHGDCGIYHSGGNALDGSQEGGPIQIQGNYFEFCNNAITAKRGVKDAVISFNHFLRCQNGISINSVPSPQNPEPGKRLVIESNVITDTVDFPIVLRGGPGRHVVVGNRITDWGYDTDGQPTTSTRKAGIDLSGTRDSLISGNHVALRGRKSTEFHYSIVLNNHVIEGKTYLHGGNLITGNWLMNAPFVYKTGDTKTPNMISNNRT